MNIVLFGMKDTMVVIADVLWLSVIRHMATCDKCQGCSTCRSENCVAATMMIETMLTPGKVNDPAR